LSGLGIVGKNRRIQKYFNSKKVFVQAKPIVYTFYPVLSLRSFDHEFTRFEKKHYPWSDLTNKKYPEPSII